MARACDSRLLSRPHEVTNAEFKEFVDAGGYQQPRLWAPEIVRDGEVVPWDEAMTLFTDRTGRPGPSTWEAGDYPEGRRTFRCPA